MPRASDAHLGRQREQPVLVGRLVRRHADRPSPRSPRASAPNARAPPRRDRSGARARRGTSACVNSVASFSPLPQPSSTTRPPSPEYLSDRGRVPLQQLQLGSRDAIPRQMTDRVEQRRAERVVQESRRQLPRVQLQVEAGGLARNRAARRGRLPDAGPPLRAAADDAAEECFFIGYSIGRTQRNVAYTYG